MQNEQSKVSFEKIIEILNNHIKNLRVEYNEKIKSLSSKILQVYDIPQLQVELYTERQIVLELMSSIQEKISAHNTTIRKYKGTLLEEKYKTNYDLRLTTGETATLIERDLAVELHVKDLLSLILEFLQETLKTFDSLIYGISNRIKAEEYRRI